MLTAKCLLGKIVINFISVLSEYFMFLVILQIRYRRIKLL